MSPLWKIPSKALSISLSRARALSLSLSLAHSLSRMYTGQKNGLCRVRETRGRDYLSPGQDRGLGLGQGWGEELGGIEGDNRINSPLT